MLNRILLALAVGALALPPATAGATGTVVIKPHEGNAHTIQNAQLLLKAPGLVVVLPDKSQIVFEQHGCRNTTEVMECQPYTVVFRSKKGSHEINVTEGLAYLNLTKIPQKVEDATPHVTLPRHGIYITLKTDEGETITIRGTVDAGAAKLTGS